MAIQFPLDLAGRGDVAGAVAVVVVVEGVVGVYNEERWTNRVFLDYYHWDEHTWNPYERIASLGMRVYNADLADTALHPTVHHPGHAAAVVDRCTYSRFC